jgi:hypothetical protein
MNASNLSRDDWIVVGLAVVLAIVLLFLPWFSISVSGLGLSLTFTSTATGDPDGWLGILAVIAVIAVIVDLLIERFSPQTSLPELGGSREKTRFILVCVAAGLLALKFLFHINHFSDLGYGFWLALVVTAALVFASLRASQGQAIMPSRPAA